MKAGEDRSWFWPRALSLRSMRGRMALMLGLAMLPAGAIAMQVGLNALEARRSAYEATLSRRALQSMDEERRVFDETREMLRILAATPDLFVSAAANCEDWMRSVASRYADLASLAVTAEDGSVVCSTPAAPPGFRARSVLRDRARARDGFTMGYVPDAQLTHGKVLAALEPVRAGGGRRIGFVSASISVSALTQMLDRNRALSGARAAIVDNSGHVIAQTTNESAAALPTAEQVRDHFGSEPHFVRVKDGAAVVAPLHAPDIYLVMSWAPDQPEWRSWTGLAVSVAAPVLIWLFAVAAGWFAIEVYVTRPLSNLESAARAYARGEELPDTAALLAAPEEIRALRRTLAAMAKTLRGREQRLVEALAEERALLREVNHRVKNNLQTVASLLNIQARGARDESEARGLSRAHDRVQLLALVHQRIYASGAVRELRVDELCADIARTLLQSRGLQNQNVRFDFAEARTDADRAVPLAFLLGEAISAALEEIGEGEEIALSLRQDEDGEVRFAVELSGEAAAIAATPQTKRLVDAFARQLGADVGRDASRPSLWIRVPPAP